jgi:hypothetical protein
VWNSEARALFFNFSSAAHFSIGADALWLDATEPEGFPHEVKSTAQHAFCQTIFVFSD